MPPPGFEISVPVIIHEERKITNILWFIKTSLQNTSSTFAVINTRNYYHASFSSVSAVLVTSHDSRHSW